MRNTSRCLAPAAAPVAALLLAHLLGCGGDLVANQTKERVGNIGMLFVNDTNFRAAFSFGTWDDLDRSPGPATLQQLRIEGGFSSQNANVPCRRNAAIGTQRFVTRVVAVEADDIATFDADAFDTTVHFSSAAADSDAAALPTQGTAEGLEVLLGVDFSCGDQLVFTFREDPDAPGGFRIDFTVIPDEIR